MKVGTTERRTDAVVGLPSGADPWRWLLRQGHAALVQQKFVLLVRPGVARQVDTHHPDGGEHLDNGARCEAARPRAGEVLHGHQQATGDERDEDVRFDPFLAPVEDRSDREVDGSLHHAHLRHSEIGLCGKLVLIGHDRSTFA
ncbi:MAG: hypothetical protein OXD42_13340 [Rhodospirillaceae bacterium]|nr:hypothetical protein [Rhodospirillaceae bacterium]